MALSESVLREELCKTAGEALNLGLVARSWGNFSCRLDSSRFLITPSGISYQDLTPQALVLLDLESLQVSGPGIPSSEKGLHQWIYRLYPETQAVVHSHQPAVSVFAACQKALECKDSQLQHRAGRIIPCTSYALSGTASMERHARKALAGADVHALILANHGVLIWGKSSHEALETALMLEEEAQKQLDQQLSRRFEEEGNYNDSRSSFFLRKTASRGSL